MLGAVANGRETKKKKEKVCLWRWYYRDLFFATFFLPFRKCDSYFSFCFKSSKTCRQEEKKKKARLLLFFFYLLKLIKQPASCYDNATEWRIRVFSPVIISCLRATKLRFYRCFFFFHSYYRRHCLLPPRCEALTWLLSPLHFSYLHFVTSVFFISCDVHFDAHLAGGEGVALL